MSKEEHNKHKHDHSEHNDHEQQGHHYKESDEEETVRHAYHEDQVEEMEETHSEHDHSEHAHENHEHHEQEGHDHHDHGGEGHHHHHGNFKELFLKSLPLGIIIMVLSPMMGITLPFQFTFQYSDILVAIVSTILLIYGGKPFYQGAIDEFKQKAPGMMALVSLGVGVSYLYSIYAVITHYTTG